MLQSNVAPDNSVSVRNVQVLFFKSSIAPSKLEFSSPAQHWNLCTSHKLLANTLYFYGTSFVLDDAQKSSVS